MIHYLLSPSLLFILPRQNSALLMLPKKQYRTNRDRYGKDEEATSLLISESHDFIPKLQDDNTEGLLSVGSSSHTPQLSRINGIQNPVENNVPKRPQRTALPRFQMLVLCVLRLSEPIAYTQIFPVSTNHICGFLPVGAD